MSRLPGLHQLSNHILQLFAQENRNNRRRCLIRSQAVVIAHVGSGLAQEIGVDVHRL